MSNEVRIKLTPEQKAKIKAATGKEMNEIRVGSLGPNPAASKSISARSSDVSARGTEELSARGTEDPTPHPGARHALISGQWQRRAYRLLRCHMSSSRRRRTTSWTVVAATSATNITTLTAMAYPCCRLVETLAPIPNA